MPTLPEDKQPHWFVMRAFRNELSMEQLFQKHKFRCFLPKREVIRHTRMGDIRTFVPVISTYIFVYSDYFTLRDFQQPLNITFNRIFGLSEGHNTMKVPDKQMEDFIRVATQHESDTRYYLPEELELQKGQRIRICGGPFEGVEGDLVKIKGLRDKRLVLSIPGIISISTAVQRTYIQLVK